jgi:hypothetical protein
MAWTRGVLQNRPILIGILLACLYETVAVWTTVLKYNRHPYNLVGVLGLAFAAFITISIAYRSPFITDRVVFGAPTVISFLTLTRMARLTSITMLAVNSAEGSMWTIAAAVSMMVLLRSFKVSHSK